MNIVQTRKQSIDMKVALKSECYQKVWIGRTKYNQI